MFTVFVGLSVTKATKFGSKYVIDWLSEGEDIWHIGSPGLAVHHCWNWWTLARGSPWSAKILKGVKISVTLFSYIIWPSAMKFGGAEGLANKPLFPEFGELDPGPASATPCGDMRQSFTDELVIIFLNYQWTFRILYNYLSIKTYYILPNLPELFRCRQYGWFRTHTPSHTHTHTHT